MFKGTKMMGVTDFDKDAAIDRQIDDVMDQIYREKYWKADGGDKAKIAALQKKVDELIAAEKAVHHQGRPLGPLHEERRHRPQRLDRQREHRLLRDPAVEQGRAPDAHRSPTGMMNAYFREFYSEKDVIMEERRLSENGPGYFFNEQVNAAFYAASPYHWDVDRLDGRPAEDHQGRPRRVPQQILRPQQRRRHLRRRLRSRQTLGAMAEKYFGRIPKGPDIEPIRTYEPPQYGEKRMYGEGPAPTSLQMMFHTPWAGQPDAAPLQVLASILGGGGGGMRGGFGPDGDEIGQRGGGGRRRRDRAAEQDPGPGEAAGRQRLGLEPGPVVRRRLPVQRLARAWTRTSSPRTWKRRSGSRSTRSRRTA